MAFRDTYNAFTHLTPAAEGARGMLRVAIKDNIAVKSLPLTCGSAFLKEHICEYDATCVQHLRGDARFAIIGKTNMDEFGMGSNSTRSVHGPVRHSRFAGRSPGGSSGGSAVAVAAHLADVALGTDTGGSVRLPASYNGVIGFKPSYGAISRHGVVAYAPSLDHVGIIGRDIDSIVTLFAAISQPCERDSTYSRLELSLDAPESVSYGTLDGTPISEGVLEAIGQPVRTLKLPMSEKDVASLYYTTALCEAASSMARFVDDAPFVKYRVRRHLLGDEVKRRIIAGNAILARPGNLYRRAQQQRLILREHMHWLFQSVDVLVLSTAEPPPLLDPNDAVRLGSEQLQDVHMRLANLTGLPAISLPLHLMHDPLHYRGTMLMAARGSDALLLRVADAMMKTYSKK